MVNTTNDAELRSLFLTNVREGDTLTFGGFFRPDLDSPTNEGHAFRIVKVGWPWLIVEPILQQELQDTQLLSVNAVINNDPETFFNNTPDSIAEGTAFQLSQLIPSNFSDPDSFEGTTVPQGYQAVFLGEGNNTGTTVQLADGEPNGIRVSCK